jgi:hypothetical protein
LSAFLANPRKRQRETETERKGFVVTKLESNAFFPKKEKRVVKKVEIFKAAFSSNVGVVTKF